MFCAQVLEVVIAGCIFDYSLSFKTNSDAFFGAPLFSFFFTKGG
jgi:hypothetical protein